MSSPTPFMVKKMTAASLCAVLGVVYGDIGTSPLYALKAVFSYHTLPVTPEAILGIVSLIFWSLFLIVSLKYALVITRADNNGEGGILSLTALITQKRKNARWVLFLGLLGASLFFGDGVITPAISVLSAVEGILVASPQLKNVVVPLAVCVLVGLFCVQKRGSGKIGQFFGPIMLIWFLVLAILGLGSIWKNPSVLKALNPWYAVSFLNNFKSAAFFCLGSVVLAVTGAEALYADLGHFGRSSVVWSWMYLVFPCLVLNYLGQGALLLDHPEAVGNPFYHLAPSFILYPLVVLATIATAIASQAVISGVFSMVWQAVQLGYLPRLRVIHTSSSHRGQVFLPLVNGVLMVLSVFLVIFFKTSDALAAAYGFAVVGLMVITSILMGVLCRFVWGWALPTTTALVGGFLIIDLSYFAATLTKIPQGGWVAIALGSIAFILLTTWIRGRSILVEQLHAQEQTLNHFLKKISKSEPLRVAGIGVYLTATPETVPTSLVLNLKHNHVMHHTTILLSVVTTSVPRVNRNERVFLKSLGSDIFQVVGFYGFMETPHIPLILEKCEEKGLKIPVSESSFFLSRGVPQAAIRPHLAPWREHLFIFMAKNALNATEFFKIPSSRVIEMGVRYTL